MSECICAQMIWIGLISVRNSRSNSGHTTLVHHISCFIDQRPTKFAVRISHIVNQSHCQSYPKALQKRRSEMEALEPGAIIFFSFSTHVSSRTTTYAYHTGSCKASGQSQVISEPCVASISHLFVSASLICQQTGESGVSTIRRRPCRLSLRALAVRGYRSLDIFLIFH